MLCEKCHVNPASVHTVAIVNGEKQEHHFCSECAREVQNSLPSMMDLLAGFGMMPDYQQTMKACDCGAGFQRFQKLGLLGCPACYTTYRSQLLPVIKRAQGGRIRHVGRRPAGYQEEGAAVPAAADAAQEQAQCPAESECARLRRELQAAIQEEHYERAAELRDRLRLLKGGDNA